MKGSNIIMSNSIFYLILLCAIISSFIIPIIIIIYITISRYNKEKALLIDEITDTLTRYKKVKLNMNENEMLSTMNFRYDKSMSNESTIYRFIYITRGGSGSVSGYISSGYNSNIRNSTHGSMFGYSEQHDESLVIIKCINNKVIEITPYNMSSIQIPNSYYELVDLANLIGITI